MKPCSVCGVTKPFSDFQIRRASKDGHTAACKQCLSARDALRIDQPNRVAARNRVRAERRDDPEKMAADTQQKRAWIARNRQKRRAHNITNNAIRDGVLIAPERCERCGKPAELHAHHEDYSLPLEVAWLCVPCHGARHREINLAARLFQPAERIMTNDRTLQPR